MEDIKEHKKKFDAIVDKYDLFEEEVAKKIADYVTQGNNGEVISAQTFSEKFGMSETEAMLFLSFISRGLRFKEENIDAK